MDTPIYIDTYFRVESGYDGGRMPEEKAGRFFFDEVKRLFTETGFSIKENKYKNDSISEYYLKLYRWFAERCRERIDVPQGCSFPIWLSMHDEYRLRNTEDTVCLLYTSRCV